MAHTVGSLIDREIDGLWFPAKIESVHGDLLTLRYLDDLKVEENVPKSEIRPHSEEKCAEETPRTRGTTSGSLKLKKPLKGTALLLTYVLKFV